MKRQVAAGAFALMIGVTPGHGADPYAPTEYEATHPADQCQEDEAWIAVHYQDPAGIEDVHGVTRACIPVDDIVANGSFWNGG